MRVRTTLERRRRSGGRRGERAPEPMLSIEPRRAVRCGDWRVGGVEEGEGERGGG